MYNSSVKHWTEKYNNKIDGNNLCFDLKESIEEAKGGHSPFFVIRKKGLAFYIIKKNKHGIILTDRNGYKIYMGKDCDVLDSNREKGFWSQKQNNYTIVFKDKTIEFNFYDLDLKKHSCSER